MDQLNSKKVQLAAEKGTPIGDRRGDSRRVVTPQELWQLLNYALNSHERRASWGRREEDFPTWH